MATTTGRGTLSCAPQAEVGMHFRSRIVTRKEQLANDDDLVALNFKVPASFRMRLKLLAAKRATTMTQLLYEGFALIDTKYARRSPGACADRADPAELAYTL